MNWLRYIVQPLPIGGAGSVQVKVDTPVDGVRVLVGTGAATSETDENSPIFADLQVDDDGLGAIGTFYGLPPGTYTASFFYLLGGVWTAGPVVPNIPLAFSYGSSFPWPKKWIVNRLQELASEAMPTGTKKPVTVVSAFPRDMKGWPCINVQVDEVSPSNVSITNRIGSSPRQDGRDQRGRNWSVNASITAWCETPEDRDALAEWLGGAMESVLDLMRFEGYQEPSFSLKETEDFQTLDVPVFLVIVTLNASKWSQLLSTPTNQFGFLGII